MEIGAVAGAHSWGLLNVRPDREILPIRRINADNALVFPTNSLKLRKLWRSCPGLWRQWRFIMIIVVESHPAKKELPYEVFGTKALVSRLTR
jgi:hypothetical protein